MKVFFNQKTGFFYIVGWAFYLACSWTWCIGMFLPVFLIRDYGVQGWLVFVIPNIVGATGMAYVLSKPDTSLEIVTKHKIACIVFSIITIIFQIYFIGWVSMLVPNTFIMITGIILLLISVLGLTFDKNQLLSASIVWILSLICFILIFHFVPIEKINLFKEGNLSHNTNALLYLTPICFFGFLLCPYLDLTFHRVIQSNTSLNSKIIFTMGFCFMFFLMVLFTFFYARPMANIIEGVTWFLKDQKPLPLAYIYLVVFHILIQAGFTVILHLRSLFQTIKRSNRTFFLLFILSIIFFLLPIIFNTKYTFLNMTVNEIIYRSFMAFYSLIAPAYVFLFLIPKNKKNISLNNYHLFIWVIVILFALPFYAVGFLGVKWNLEICSLIGLVIVLLSRVLIRDRNVNF